MKIGGEFSRLISCAAIAFSGLSGAALPRPILASEANYQATLAVGDGNQEKGATCYVKDSPIVTQTPSLKEQVTIFYATCVDYGGEGGKASIGIPPKNPVSGTFTVDNFSAIDNTPATAAPSVPGR